jgi:hypothetical protein
MSETAEPEIAKKPWPRAVIGLAIGIWFIAGPIVVVLAGIAARFGERQWGSPGYWASAYATAPVAAGLVALLLGRLFGHHPLYWALGVLVFFVFGHLMWALLGGRAIDTTLSTSDQSLAFMAAGLGLFLGIALASTILARRVSNKESRPD